MTRVGCRGLFFFCIKNIKTNKNLKILDFFVKLYPRILGLAATLDLRIIFIILIIKLNNYEKNNKKNEKKKMTILEEKKKQKTNNKKIEKKHVGKVKAKFSTS